MTYLMLSTANWRDSKLDPHLNSSETSLSDSCRLLVTVLSKGSLFMFNQEDQLPPHSIITLWEAQIPICFWDTQWAECITDTWTINFNKHSKVLRGFTSTFNSSRLLRLTAADLQA